MTRATPPSEHLDYLQEIGVDILSSGTTSTHARSVPAPRRIAVSAAPARPARPHSPAAVAPRDLIVDTPPARTPARGRRVPRHLPGWWPIVEWAVRLAFFFALLLLLAPLLMARLGLAEEQPAPAAPTSASTSSRSTEEHDTVKRPTTKSRKAKTAPTPKHENEKHDEAAVNQADAPPKGSDSRNAPGSVGSGPTEMPVAAALPSVAPATRVEPIVRRADPSGGVEGSRPEPASAQSSAAPGLHGTSHSGVELVVGISLLAGLGYLGWDRLRLAERLSRIERELKLSPTEALPAVGLIPEEETPRSRADASNLLSAPSPEAALTALVAEAKKRGFATVPGSASRPWGAGVASITGNVRRENQDAAIAFEVGSTTVLIVADGLGGLPHGQEAARLAVGAASLTIAEALGREASPPALPELVAEEGLLEAAPALCRKARASGWVTNLDGFRTTLIVVVATPTAYGYAYLGDGGGVVLRQPGASEAFLVPQKADGVANIVAGSLGPVIQGSPVVGQLARKRGDALLIGTDGVFDRTQSDFGPSVAKLLARHNGDSQAVAALVVADFASAKEGTRYVCDDNMSLAILCTPAPRPAAADLTLQRPHAARR